MNRVVAAPSLQPVAEIRRGRVELQAKDIAVEVDQIAIAEGILAKRRRLVDGAGAFDDEQTVLVAGRGDGRHRLTEAGGHANRRNRRYVGRGAVRVETIDQIGVVATPQRVGRVVANDLVDVGHWLLSDLGFSGGHIAKSCSSPPQGQGNRIWPFRRLDQGPEGAAWRDLLPATSRKSWKQGPDCAALRAASLGTTGFCHMR
jgi:hypothetical protein